MLVLVLLFVVMAKSSSGETFRAVAASVGIVVVVCLTSFKASWRVDRAVRPSHLKLKCAIHSQVLEDIGI